MPDSITERIRRLRKDALEIAENSLDHHDVRVYRGLSDVAVRLTDLIQQSDITESPATVSQPTYTPPETTTLTESEGDSYESEAIGQPTHASQRITISARYGRVTHKALLDISRISGGGRGKCVWYKGEWMTTSGAAGRITGNAINGWQNFWRYKRDNGLEGPVSEIRDALLRSDHQDDVPW